jgi:chorismate mutase
LESPAHTDLLSYRGTIDNLDAALIRLLAERFKATRAIGAIKAAGNLPSVDHDREVTQTRRLRAIADEAGLSPDFAEQVFRLVVTQVTKEHEALRAI